MKTYARGGVVVRRCLSPYDVQQTLLPYETQYRIVAINNYCFLYVFILKTKTMINKVAHEDLSICDVSWDNF